MSTTKWEYQFVTFKPRYGGKPFRVNEVNGRVPEDWEEEKSPTMYDYSNTLGEQGWELFFYEPTSNGYSVQAVFKRTKQPDPNAPVTYAPHPLK